MVIQLSLTEVSCKVTELYAWSKYIDAIKLNLNTEAVYFIKHLNIRSIKLRLYPQKIHYLAKTRTVTKVYKHNIHKQGRYLHVHEQAGDSISIKAKFWKPKASLVKDLHTCSFSISDCCKASRALSFGSTERRNSSMVSRSLDFNHEKNENRTVNINSQILILLYGTAERLELKVQNFK